MKKERIVAISPFAVKGSEFIDLQKESINKNGFEVVDGSFKNIFLHPLKARKISVVVLNWFEEVNNKNSFTRVCSILKKKAILAMLRIYKIKIISIIHNKKSHDFSESKKSNILKILLKRSSVVVGLCKETLPVLYDACGHISNLEQKMVIVPHPNFIDSYSPSGINFRKQLCIPENRMVVLFFGTIRKYKNIELIIEAAKKVRDIPVYFIIAGKGDDKYVDELIQRSEDNVMFMNRFIENSEIADLYNCCDLCIAPLDYDSCLNSATCLAAFSFKKNIICPKIGTIKDLEADLTYSYSYQDSEDHLQKVIEMIRVSYKDFKNNRFAFEEKGTKLFDMVKEDNSFDEVTKKWGIALEKAINR